MNNSPAGLLGQAPRLTNQQPNNNMLQGQSRPGLVGNYQPRMPNAPNQSILGINNPNNINQNTRPNFNNNPNGFNNNNNNNTNRNINNSSGLNNQGGSLMGNRPAVVNPNPNGLIPMQRPGINPALVGNNGPIGQGVGLLNNPRIPHSIGGAANINMNNNNNNNPNAGIQRQEWDTRNNQGQFNGSVVSSNNQANQMMLINQQANTRIATNSYSYGAGVSPAMNQQNGILPNPPHPFQQQTQQQQPPIQMQQQQQIQPNFQHPHASQQGYSQTGMMANGMIGGMISHQAYSQDQGYYQRLQTESGIVGSQHHHQMQMKMSDLEFQEAFEKNRIVSSSAITRALQDASIG